MCLGTCGYQKKRLAFIYVIIFVVCGCNPALYYDEEENFQARFLGPPLRVCMLAVAVEIYLLPCGIRFSMRSRIGKFVVQRKPH
jgi:uncharacterized membrane protein YbhN (UPF0104 family)